MKFKVKCTLGTLDTVIAKINELEETRDYDGLIDQFIDRVAEDIKDHAEKGYKHIHYGGDIKVAMSNEITEKGQKVNANGQAVAFIEWGAGIENGGVAPNPLGGAGSYGKGQGKRDGDAQGWAYYGYRGTAYDDHLIGGERWHNRKVKGRWVSNDHESIVKNPANKNKTLYFTYGSPPNRVMMNASEHMRSNLKTVATEVFSND